MFDTDTIAETGDTGGYRRPIALRATDLLETMITREFAGRIALVSSFEVEAAVLLDLVTRVDRDTSVIFIDIGQLFPETFGYRDRLVEHCGLTNIRTIEPDAELVASRDGDGSLWPRDPDACCTLRKVAPLEAALLGFDAWISGRKRFHGDGRKSLETIEDDGERAKINPLAHWTEADIERHMMLHDLPRHPLAAEGFASLGCQTCTRRIVAGESVRDGRWTGMEKTECGIHLSGGSFVRGDVGR